jgi:hypothetical protein
MNIENLNQKSIELIGPINKQINMTDDATELTLLAMLMMNKSRDILDRTRGSDLRKKLFSEFSE